VKIQYQRSNSRTCLASGVPDPRTPAASAHKALCWRRKRLNCLR
jgi:hypothetical protein